MRFSGAIAISVGVHAVLGVVLALYLHHAPSRVTLAELDLSSVDLSFAETVAETAPVAPAPPAAPPASSAQPPPPSPPPPRPQEEIRPDVPGDVVLPVPETPVERMEMPKVPDPEMPVETKPEEPIEKKPEKPIETPAEKPVLKPAEEKPPTPVAPPAAPAPRQARVDAPPRPKRAIRPEYPKRARERGEQGDVTLLLAVTPEGAVSSVSIAVSSGFPELDEAAVRAARAARFKPARLKDAPVASTARLTLSFRLR